MTAEKNKIFSEAKPSANHKNLVITVRLEPGISLRRSILRIGVGGEDPGR